MTLLQSSYYARHLVKVILKQKLIYSLYAVTLWGFMFCSFVDVCTCTSACCPASWGEIPAAEKLSRAAHTWECGNYLCSEWNLSEIHPKSGRHCLTLQQVGKLASCVCTVLIFAVSQPVHMYIPKFGLLLGWLTNLTSLEEIIFFFLSQLHKRFYNM